MVEKKDKFSSWILQPWYMQEQRQDPEIHRQQSKVAEACWCAVGSGRVHLIYSVEVD